MSVNAPVEVSQCVVKTALACGKSLRQFLDQRGRGRRAPVNLLDVAGNSVSLADFAPALAEFAPFNGDRLIARRQQARDRRLHAARSRRRERYDRILRPEDVLQVFARLLEDRIEVRGAMVNDRFGHRRQHLRRDIRRSRGEKCVLHHKAFSPRSRLSRSSKRIRDVCTSTRIRTFVKK
jgi:hypothetical protein